MTTKSNAPRERSFICITRSSRKSPSRELPGWSGKYSCVVRRRPPGGWTLTWMCRAARILRRHDGFEPVATFRVGELVASIAVAAIVVFAVLVGMPEVEQDPLDRFAIG